MAHLILSAFPHFVPNRFLFQLRCIWGGNKQPNPLLHKLNARFSQNQMQVELHRYKCRLQKQSQSIIQVQHKCRNQNGVNCRAARHTLSIFTGQLCNPLFTRRASKGHLLSMCSLPETFAMPNVTLAPGAPQRYFIVFIPQRHFSPGAYTLPRRILCFCCGLLSRSKPIFCAFEDFSMEMNHCSRLFHYHHQLDFIAAWSPPKSFGIQLIYFVNTADNIKPHNRHLITSNQTLLH